MHLPALSAGSYDFYDDFHQDVPRGQHRRQVTGRAGSRGRELAARTPSTMSDELEETCAGWPARAGSGHARGAAAEVERVNPASSSPSGDVAAPPQIQAILTRTCYDCHSNQTRWPWYSRVAPVSWLIVHDVTVARKEINFSEWGGYYPRTRQAKTRVDGPRVAREIDAAVVLPVDASGCAAYRR